MKFQELLENRENLDFMQIMQEFLPMAMDELGINVLPQFKLCTYVPDVEQPTFGRFDPDNNIIWLAIENRHPIDILRTLAHELTHFRQGLRKELAPGSGQTGSPEENEAHEIAGIIMRNFGKRYPQYFKVSAVDLIG